jgi:hypothetical protein
MVYGFLCKQVYSSCIGFLSAASSSFLIAKIDVFTYITVVHFSI